MLATLVVAMILLWVLATARHATTGKRQGMSSDVAKAATR